MLHFGSELKGCDLRSLSSGRNRRKDGVSSKLAGPQVGSVSQSNDQSHAAHGLDRVAAGAIDQAGMSSMICRVNRATRCSAVMTASM
jgi:hypothetical protein